MKIVGIIAEYNPFHNGHHYQLQEIKKNLHADGIIVIMSGNFVQRGEPAFLDKHIRTQMALLGGANLVFELPVLFSTGSAEIFAHGAVSLLHALGCVNELAFGAETTNLPLLKKIAHILAKEPGNYQTLLQSYQKQGDSYPVASSKALSAILTKNDFSEDTSNPLFSTETEKEETDTEFSLSKLQTVLSQPNNILAIQYLKALILLKSPIQPVLIKRTESNYHDTTLHAQSLYSSASAIRNCIFQKEKEKTLDSFLATTDVQALESILKMPRFACEHLLNQGRQHLFVSKDQLSLPLHTKLVYEEVTGFDSYLDVTQEISDKIRKNLSSYESFSQFENLLKSKDLTATRISRCLLHIYLNLTKNLWTDFQKTKKVAYIRPLGFDSTGKELLRIISQSSSLLILSKLSNASSLIEERFPKDSLAKKMFERDLLSNALYDTLLTESSHLAVKNEKSKPMVIS